MEFGPREEWRLAQGNPTTNRRRPSRSFAAARRCPGELTPSLGGAESLDTEPTTTTHHGLSADERACRGITEPMIRLSVGLEDTADLIADLRQALDAAN